MQTLYWDLKNPRGYEAIEEAAKLIRNGEVVAFPTETVYGLGANGLDGAAVKKIFAAKGRPADNPLILHIADKKDIAALTSGLTANAEALLDTFWPGPLTMIVAKSSLIPDETTAGLDTVAVRMPSHPVAAEFIKKCGVPIAAPSANISGKPSPTNARDVLEDMDGKIAGILDGGMCGIGVESTIVDTTTPIATILRPGGITREMLENRLGAVDIDPSLLGSKVDKPKAPGMKYRHYAPEAPMYIYEGPEAEEALLAAVQRALKAGTRVGVLCPRALCDNLQDSMKCQLAPWGRDKSDLAENLYNILRGFDRSKPDLILALGVTETGLGLADMNRMRKAAGFNILWADNGKVSVKSGRNFPAFVLG
jgi:L-threonylcarbamoyladenylate synthase